MASYKVPQDVEADDKLIGPFSFRQFIYLIIVALAGVLAWGLAQLFIGLAIIPLPVIVFFGALALPLRKDQPMEIYMAAMVSFYLKPRQRLWDPEGIETLIEVTAPKVTEVRRIKDLSQNEAVQRLSYLSNLVDSGGWSIRGATGAPMAGTSMNNDIYLEAQSATDVLDTNTSVAHAFDQMMDQTTARMHEEAKARMFQPQPATQAPAQAFIQPQQAQATPQYVGVDPTITSGPAVDPNLHFNPYPTFHQSVIQPLNDAAHQAQINIDDVASPVAPPVPAQAVTATTTQPVYINPAPVPPKVEETAPTTSDSELTAGIMNLANNPDLSIETIAHEAHRLHKKAESESDEVLISLR
jgi:hypothetical protein